MAANKPFDVIVFGASGGVGRCVAKYFHFLGTGRRWAIAGRNHSKLAAVKAELIEMKVQSPLPDILIADVADARGLKELFATCKLVLNCTGPYRELGNDILEACLAGYANYMDLCAEPSFFEQSFLNYHDMAASKGLLIMHACAFDSVPADLGCLFAMQQFPPQMCSSIESYLVVRCPEGLSAHYAAFEGAIHDFAESSTVAKIRMDINEKYKIPKLLEVGPKLKTKSSYFFEKRIQKYALPFVGLDASVIENSRRTISLLEGQVCWPQYRTYVATSKIMNVAATTLIGSMCSSLATFALGRSLLLTFPEIVTGGVISHGGPTVKQLERTTFELHLFAKGYSTYNPDLLQELAEASAAASSSSNDSSGDRASIAGSKEQSKKANEKSTMSSEKEDLAVVNKEQSANGGNLDSSDRTAVALMIQPVDVRQTTVLGKSCAAAFFEYSGKMSGPIIPPPPQTDRDIHIVVSGPEPGFVATPIIIVTLAVALLEERDDLPVGGVFTPAAAFCKSTSIIDRLDKAGIAFTIKDSSLLNESQQFLDEFVVTNVSTEEDDDSQPRQHQLHTSSLAAIKEESGNDWDERDGYEAELQPESIEMDVAVKLEQTVDVSETVLPFIDEDVRKKKQEVDEQELVLATEAVSSEPTNQIHVDDRSVDDEAAAAAELLTQPPLQQKAQVERDGEQLAVLEENKLAKITASDATATDEQQQEQEQQVADESIAKELVESVLETTTNVNIISVEGDEEKKNKTDDVDGDFHDCVEEEEEGEEHV